MELRNSPHEREQFEITNAQRMLYLVIGEPDSALASALTAKAALEKLDNQYNLPGAYLNIGRAQIILGDKESAYQNFATALQLCREQGAEWAIGLVLVELALVAELNLRFAEAREYYQAVMRGTTSSWQFWNYPQALIGLGRVELILGNLIEAVDTQASALETMRDNPSLGFHLDCFVEVALILQSVGDTALAVVLLEYCTSHPECFQPTRNRTMAYLAAIREETLNLDVSTTRNLFPVAKVDAAALLIDRLLRVKANRG